MKRKRLLLAIAALLAAGGLWLTREPRHAQANKTSTVGVGSKTPDRQQSPDGQPKPRQMHRPPDPTRRFTDFTPEQRVEFARKGHGPGG